MRTAVYGCSLGARDAPRPDSDIDLLVDIRLFDGKKILPKRQSGNINNAVVLKQGQDN